MIRYDLGTRRAQAAEAPGFLDGVAVDGSDLIGSSFAQDLSAGPQGTDQVATLDSPQWAAPPSQAGLPR